MSEERGCFVCGCRLATGERIAVEVEGPVGKIQRAEACTVCWARAVASGGLPVVGNGVEYTVRRVRWQLDLFVGGVVGKNGGWRRRDGHEPQVE